VGPEREVFTAHRNILSKSLKFNAQCNNEHYTEGSTKEIELPDHNPDIFTVLLEYLYKGDYWPMEGEELPSYRSDDEDVQAAQTQREADLYTLAGYCQLWDLQQLVVEKIRKLKPLSVESFLSISKYIYDNNRGTSVYREYFREEITEYLSLATIETWVMDQIQHGGELATDLFLAQRDSRKAEMAVKDEDSEARCDIEEPDEDKGWGGWGKPVKAKKKSRKLGHCKGCNCT